MKILHHIGIDYLLPGITYLYEKARYFFPFEKTGLLPKKHVYEDTIYL